MGRGRGEGGGRGGRYVFGFQKVMVEPYATTRAELSLLTERPVAGQFLFSTIASSGREHRERTSESRREGEGVGGGPVCEGIQTNPRRDLRS
jgi:hypothetical protein